MELIALSDGDLNACSGQGCWITRKGRCGGAVNDVSVCGKNGAVTGTEVLPSGRVIGINSASRMGANRRDGVDCVRVDSSDIQIFVPACGIDRDVNGSTYRLKQWVVGKVKGIEIVRIRCHCRDVRKAFARRERLLSARAEERKSGCAKRQLGSGKQTAF